jgi:hypothetical protein
MTASTALAVPGAGLVERKLRKTAGLDQLQVFLHRAFYATVDFDAARKKSPQGTGTDSPHHNGIDCRPAQGLQGLTIAVYVVSILVDDRLHPTVFALYDHEETGRSKVTVHGALRALVILGRKGDLHVRVPRVMVSLCSLRLELLRRLCKPLLSNIKGGFVNPAGS